MAQIARIAKTLDNHGDRFIARCFAPEEREKVENAGQARRTAGYAKRWAAKEAAAKALGRGIRDDIFLRDIVVVNDDSGRPGIVLRGGAQRRLAALTPPGMAADVHVSLCDEGGFALAFVTISARR